MMNKTPERLALAAVTAASLNAAACVDVDADETRKKDEHAVQVHQSPYFMMSREETRRAVLEYARFDELDRLNTSQIDFRTENFADLISPAEVPFAEQLPDVLDEQGLCVNETDKERLDTIRAILDTALAGAETSDGCREYIEELPGAYEKRKSCPSDASLFSPNANNASIAAVTNFWGDPIDSSNTIGDSGQLDFTLTRVDQTAGQTVLDHASFTHWHGEFAINTGDGNGLRTISSLCTPAAEQLYIILHQGVNELALDPNAGPVN